MSSSDDDMAGLEQRPQPKPRRRPRPVPTRTTHTLLTANAATPTAPTSQPAATTTDASDDDFFRQNTLWTTDLIAQSIQRSTVSQRQSSKRTDITPPSGRPTKRQTPDSTDSTKHAKCNSDSDGSDLQVVGDTMPAWPSRDLDKQDHDWDSDISLTPPPPLPVHLRDSPSDSSDVLIVDSASSPSPTASKPFPKATTPGRTTTPIPAKAIDRSLAALDPELQAIASSLGQSSTTTPHRQTLRSPAHFQTPLRLDLTTAMSTATPSTPTIVIRIVPAPNFYGVTVGLGGPPTPQPGVGIYQLRIDQPFEAIFSSFCRQRGLHRQEVVMAYHHVPMFGRSTPQSLDIVDDVEFTAYLKVRFEESKRQHEAEYQAKLRQMDEEAQLDAYYQALKVRSNSSHEDTAVSLLGHPQTTTDASPVGHGSSDDGEGTSGPHVKIKLRGRDGVDTTTVQELIAQYTKRLNIDTTASTARIEFDGEILDDGTTVEDLDLDDGDQLTVVLRPR
ncbi:hypothetical protein H4R34_000892 [Dimargaris verticillata]|uniref:Ubiquitin-like domain-containing protein n=1 Tax=Dimargaris verticillata TaxID=2761393 RepID=A0A9W8BB07_9FUNG|nr:hypothetical protein H4R34_000892 [Dimargaris verticillata]